MRMVEELPRATTDAADFYSLRLDAPAPARGSALGTLPCPRRPVIELQSQRTARTDGEKGMNRHRSKGPLRAGAAVAALEIANPEW